MSINCDKKIHLSKQEYQDMLHTIKSYPIEQYALMLGLTPVTKGEYISLKEHDSCMIKPSNNTFKRYSTGANGSVIDFAKEFDGQFENRSDNMQILLELYTIISGREFEPIDFEKARAMKKEVVPFNLPKRDNNVKNAYAYLLNERKISKEIVSKFISEKRLYQDERKNCVFVSFSKSGEAEFANFRGTNVLYEKQSGHRYLGDIKGSNYDRCFVVDNFDEGKVKKADTLIVTEGVIDLMSVMTLTKEENRSLYAYQALSSTSKYRATVNYVKDNSNIKNVWMALDSDDKGVLAMEWLKNALKEAEFKGEIKPLLPPDKDCKDWNDFLKKRVAKQEQHEKENKQKKEKCER